jgi:hypothetical protein
VRDEQAPQVTIRAPLRAPVVTVPAFPLGGDQLDGIYITRTTPNLGETGLKGPLCTGKRHIYVNHSLVESLGENQCKPVSLVEIIGRI